MKRFLIHVDTNWCGEEDTFSYHVGILLLML